MGDAISVKMQKLISFENSKIFRSKKNFVSDFFCTNFVLFQTFGEAFRDANRGAMLQNYLLVNPESSSLDTIKV